MNYSKDFCLFRMKRSIFQAVLGLATGLAISAMAQAPGGEGFGAPEQAVTALRETLQAKDGNRLRAIFGPEAEDLVNPDRVQATNEFQMVSQGIEEAHSLVNAGGRGLLRGLAVSGNPVQVVARCREKGMLVSVAGDKLVRFAPPYIVERAQLDEAVRILRGVLAEGVGK